MNVITYSLRNNQPRSDDYFDTVATFTDEVLSRVDQAVGSLVTAYLATTEEQCTRPEYLYELLALGIFWQVYGSRTVGQIPQHILSRLTRWRRMPLIDPLRGALATLFLTRTNHSSSAAPTLDQITRLIDWMEASGDFEQEAERLRVWLPLLTEAHLSAITTLAGWFTARSLEILGPYTPNVETFLAETHPRYRWREDVIFCGRQRVEYHLCMVGIEIMNRAFREKFLATQQKIVLVPPCMRAKPADECQARETPFGAQCADCEPRCHVHQVTKLGEKHGFGVFMLPDELASFSPQASEAIAQVGIVGVSCPLTNPQGGWKARGLGIPAQGLPLDYCGCSWHWHLDGGIPTNINLKQLLRLLDLEADSH